jgi:biopolymer transport protein ExbB/TolQ
MSRSRVQYLGLFLLALTPVVSPIVVAEIYKWVDASGNVHYGDKPNDPVQAQKAQQVELQESYKPAERTAQEQQAYDEEQRRISLRNEMRRNEEAQALEEAQAKEREEKEALCTKYEETIGRLSTVQKGDGIPYFVYLKDEEGKSVSAQRQREIIEELKTKRKDAGCT